MSMSALPPVASFWTGSPLSFVERLCLTSFRDQGHPFTLYCYEPIAGVPDGIDIGDAADILPRPATYTTHPRTGSPAPFADRFRYHLLKRRPGVIWADTDAYCLRPFAPDTDGYLLAWESGRRALVPNGVMAMPADSPALDQLIAWTGNEYAVLPWLPPKLLDRACARQRDGRPLHISQLPWGMWGPAALTHVLKKTGEAEHAMLHDVLWPVSYEHRRRYFRVARKTWDLVTDRTQSIHFYGRRVRDRLVRQYGDVPPDGSILYELGARHRLLPRPSWAPLLSAPAAATDAA